MNAITGILSIIIILPVLITWIFYRYLSKFLWCAPVIILIITSCLFIKDIESITSEPTFAAKWALYFHNDWSMGFYLIYLPIVVNSVIITVIAYLIKHFKVKRTEANK